MIKSAVTISLVPEARGGPFVFWDDLEAGCRKAAELGFDGVEVFAPDGEAIRRSNLRRLLDDHGLKLAAAGTGAGWVKHKLTLTDPEPAKQRAAREFIRFIIDVAGEFGAPAIVGSMQGRIHQDEYVSMKPLTESLHVLASHAQQYGVPLIFEPLNRYETNIANRLEYAASIMDGWAIPNVRILADLFHMNIEETDMAEAIRRTGAKIGHVHLADSNRHPAGLGHTDFAPIGAALREVGYDGFVSAEAFPRPNEEQAARHTMIAFRKYFAGN